MISPSWKACPQCGGKRFQIREWQSSVGLDGEWYEYSEWECTRCGHREQTTDKCNDLTTSGPPRQPRIVTLDVPHRLPLPEQVVGQCLDRQRSVAIEDITGVNVHSDRSRLDRIPRHYERQPFGVGDRYLIEIVSFVTAGHEVLYDVVPQEWDCLVDEPGETRYTRSGRSIGDVLAERSSVRYVVLYTWDFNGSSRPVKDTKTLEIIDVA